MKIKCDICPIGCLLKEGTIGLCKARTNRSSSSVSLNYGQITSIALDPIEKKPLFHFMPNSKVLSVGSFGCNLNCYFCQNHKISTSDGKNLIARYISPKSLIEIANKERSNGNVGIAFTYNEPLIGYEYILDCSKIARYNDLAIILVTNGFINKKILQILLPYFDAANIDLKSFSNQFYKVLGGNLQTVLNNIEFISKHKHIEITILIIEGENDSDLEMERLSKWLANINPNIPLHISRFFPTYKAKDKSVTSIKTILRLVDIAKQNLKYVYPGNC